MLIKNITETIVEKENFTCKCDDALEAMNVLMPTAFKLWIYFYMVYADTQEEFTLNCAAAAKQTHISRASIYTSLAELEKNGYIEKHIKGFVFIPQPHL